MSVKHAWTGALVALVFFLGAAALLNPLCLALAPIAVIDGRVPYGKRFTTFRRPSWVSPGHGPDRRWLGSAASGPGPVISARRRHLIGGFDLIYAPGSRHDRSGVMSVPAASAPRRDPRARASARPHHALLVWYASPPTPERSSGPAW